MKERCPNAVVLSSAVLQNYRLGFTIFAPHRQCAAADIISSVGDAVYGILYELDTNGQERLDHFEGCPDYYRSISVPVGVKGKVLEARVYEVVHKQSGLLPSRAYMKLLCDAARYFSFPYSYQFFLSSVETLEGSCGIVES